MFVNRWIYHKGSTAVTRQSTPWEMQAKLPAHDDDSGSSTGLKTGPRPTTWPASGPTSSTSSIAVFPIEAARYNVLPLDDRRVERFNADLAGPSSSAATPSSQFGGMGRLSENSVLVIKNKSHAVTAEVVVPEPGAEGVIIAQGGSIGGWSLYG